MKVKIHVICGTTGCETEVKRYKTTDRYCQKCLIEKAKKKREIKMSGETIKLIPAKPRKPINKVSKKQQVINLKYSSQRIVFLGKPENKICFIDGCNRQANTVEHTKGRKGFADEYARENNITLTLDERFWKPCCLQHNLELENNPELSKEYQLSKLHSGNK